jgi:hypothetical protein
MGRKSTMKQLKSLKVSISLSFIEKRITPQVKDIINNIEKAQRRDWVHLPNNTFY